MTDRFVTAFHPEGYKTYGHRLTESFAKFTPEELQMWVYASDIDANMKNCYDHLFQVHLHMRIYEQFSIPELRDFLERHRHQYHVHGKQVDRRWKPKDIAAGYNYRFDMFKFCRMIYVMWAEAHRDPTGRMVWLDGDCVLRKQLPDDFIDRALPNGEAYAYLGRPGKYSETGFLVFDVKQCLPILDAWAAYCTNDTFLNEKEQHSAYLWDRAREKFPEIKGYNLTPNGRGHVIYQCWVGEYIMHLKGKRKYNGICPEGERAKVHYEVKRQDRGCKKKSK